MVKLGEPSGPLATAQALASQGLQVFPARYRDKAPIVKWRDYQGISTTQMLPTWFGSGAQRNFWVMTGRMSNHVVVDADTAAGDAWWREQLGDEVMDSAAKVKTAKGTHYWFRILENWNANAPIPSWSIHPLDGEDPTGVSFDFRADATGVIVPPSVHESGVAYEWVVPLEQAAVAPAVMLDGTLRAQAPASPSQGHGSTTVGHGGGSTRSMLTTLLGRPPGAEGSGRNDWLARVAGHYAKTYHNQEDLYQAHCQQANQSMGQPLDNAEFTKTIESVWRGEHERNAHRAMDESCGWLQSGGTRIMTQVVLVRGDERVYELAEYADFDLRAKGVMLSDDQNRTYWLQIVRKRRGVGDTETIDAVLPGHTMGDDRALRKWLAGFACTIIPPENMWPKNGGSGTRLQRYLESQHPPAVKVTRTLGWDAEILDGHGGFVTHEGVITADNTYECESVGVRPDPSLLAGKMAPHHYGFHGTDAEARRVLTEVLTFHDEQVTAVFGAWWAACLIKPQIESRTSLFPFMAIEAPSESGKTNGYFDLMTQMNGNTRGETQPTKAALRDMAAAHRNGIVWVDDLDDPAYLMELLRAATSGGSLTKMGEDRASVTNTHIVAPIVISGEALGLGSQKALLDRAIIVKAGSPTDRRSLHNSNRPQWDDVLALREQYPTGLSDLAGWFVQLALQEEERVLAALKECRSGAGRSADKTAILRAGARLLDYLVTPGEAAWAGTGIHARRVDQWLEGAAANAAGASENTLTLEILPWALRTFRYPEKPIAGATDRDLDAPVFIKSHDKSTARLVQSILGEPLSEEGPEIWFSATLLAHAWEREKHGRVERRTQTHDALRDQADAVGAGPAKRMKITGGGGRLAYYRAITGPLAETLIERARGQG